MIAPARGIHPVYRSIGSIAELLDVSCIAFAPSFPTIQDDLFNIWTTVIPQPIQAIMDALHALNPPNVLAQHFFQPNPTTGQGVSPTWDFRSNPAFKGHDDAFFLGRANGSIPSPQDPSKDVVWLHIANVQGHTADDVFRFDTVGGQPPTSVCKPVFRHMIFTDVSYSASTVPTKTSP